MFFTQTIIWSSVGLLVSLATWTISISVRMRSAAMELAVTSAPELSFMAGITALIRATAATMLAIIGSPLVMALSMFSFHRQARRLCPRVGARHAVPLPWQAPIS